MNSRSGKLSCSVCQNEIPQSSKETPEGSEYVHHFCSSNCKKKWGAKEESQDIADKISNPERFYDGPYAILQDSALTKSQKLKILLNWESDALEILKADEENMSGETRSRLSEVKQAIIKLKNQHK